MGHLINIIVQDYGKTEAEHRKAKSILVAEANQQAEWYGDSHCGIGEVDWVDREFDSYEDACDYLSSHDGFYWQGGCRYREYANVANKKSESLKKKAEVAHNKKVEMKTDLDLYVKKNNVKNRKSVYVGCPKCGSKLHKDYIPLLSYSQNCPCCKTNLFSATVQTRIEKYRKDIADLEKQELDLTKQANKEKQSKAKYKVMLALKYEYHC